MSKENDRPNAPTLEALKNLLLSYGIPVHTWGTGSAKTIEHLLNEVHEGSSQIVNEREAIRRVVRSSNIRVYYGQNNEAYYLKEDRQVFNDGRIRRRNFAWSVSEKIESGEVPQGAALRGLQEELGIHILDDQNLQISEVIRENIDSPSYPGLNSYYESNFFDIFLTRSQFNPEGYREIQADKTTYWVWEKIPEFLNRACEA